MSRSFFLKWHKDFGPKVSGIERRKRIRNAVRRMGLSFFTLQRGPKAATPTVGIVGGGFAGLAAAHYLSQHGVEPVVFEARDRVGGRVYTRDDIAGGRLIEAGAELIGLVHPIWLDLALQLGLGLSMITDESHYTGQGLEVPVYVDGKRRVGPRAEATYKEMFRMMLRLSDLASEVNPLQPWKAKRARKWDQMTLEDWIQGEKMSEDCKAALRIEFANNNGAPVHQQSLLFNLSQISGGGGRKYWDNAEVFRSGSGNDTLAKRLRQAVKEMGGKVKLNAPVRRIHADESRGVELTFGPKAEKRLFDFVILAIPPSTWDYRLAITPDFNAAQYRVTMGSAVKYLSPLKRRFWLESRLAPSSSSTDYGMTWEGTDNQIEPDGGTFELSLFAGGTAADNAVNAPDPHAFYQPLLAKVYGEGYSKNLLRKQAVFMAWPRERWTNGGYSCLRPGEVTGQAQNLASPFKKRLYFAGEHTCPAFYGYMEGALHSGYHAGKNILLKAGWRKGRGMEQALPQGQESFTGKGFVAKKAASDQRPTALLQSLINRWKL